MRPRPADYTQPGERILLQARRHPLSVLDEVLAVLVVWGLLLAGGLWLLFWSGLVLQPIVANWIVVGMVVASTLAITLVVYRLLRMLTSLYTVTDQRVYEAHGRLWFHLLQTTYDRITDLQVRQSPFGRMLGFGTVTLQTAGTGLPLVGIREPLDVKVQVEQARHRFLQTLTGGTQPPGRKPKASLAAPGEAPAKRTAPAPDMVVWQGRPSGAWLAMALLRALPFFLFGALLLVGGLVAGTPMWMGGALALVIGAATVASAVIQYTRTRYEVRSQGLVVTSGWLGRRRVETTYEKVTDITTKQTLFARLLGFGTIEVSTAGSAGGVVVFTGVEAPEQVKGIMAEARTRRLEA